MYFENLSFPVNQLDAIYHQLSQNGEKAHFYGANGFPTQTYQPFLEKLSANYALTSLSLRACWTDIAPPRSPVDWGVYADDLIHFIEEFYDTPIIGIGHSQGATSTLIAAYRRPDLFKTLILIEPASVIQAQAILMKYLPFWFKKRYEPIKSTLIKPSVWSSPEEYFQYLRKNRAYKRIQDDNLLEISKNSLKIHEEGTYKLIFSPVWEALNYATPPNVDHLIKACKVPIKVVAGKPSLFFSPKIREAWKKKSDNFSLSSDENYGHLFPFENPELCVTMVLS